jgi:hypothetical protein
MSFLGQDVRVCTVFPGLFYQILSARLRATITLCLAIITSRPQLESKMTAETLRVRFSFLANSLLGPVTDYDVAMAYELFLGRSPENSTAINSHKQRRFDDMIKTFIRSEEFSTATYNNLAAGNPVSRPDNTRSPSRQQMSWITKKMILTEEERNDLYTSDSWESFFNKIILDDEHTPEVTVERDNEEPTIHKIPEPVVNNEHAIMIAIQNIQALLDEVKIMIKKR